MSTNLLTFRLNTYLATFIVTLFGAGASLLIIHIANTDVTSVGLTDSPRESTDISAKKVR